MSSSVDIGTAIGEMRDEDGDAINKMMDRFRTSALGDVEARESDITFEDFYRRILGWGMPPYQKDLVPYLLDDDLERFLMLAPPGHAKSTLIRIFAAWLIGHNPNVRIIVATHTIEYSRKILSAVESIMKTEAYKKVFGDLLPSSTDNERWTKTEKTVKRTDWRHSDPTLLALGIGSSTIGYRCTHILFDDIVTLGNSMTQNQRDNIQQWFHTSLMPRLDPGGRVVGIGSRFYKQDLYGKIINNKSWNFVTKVFTASKDNPLWPGMFGEDKLANVEREDWYTYQAQYLMDPPNLESSFLSEAFLHYYLELPDNLVVHQGVDPDIVGAGQSSSGRKTDEFAHATIGVDQNDTVYLLEIINYEASAAEQEETIVAQAKKWDPVGINVETDAAQSLWYQNLINSYTLPFNSVTSEGRSKAVRFASMSSYFRNKRVLVPGQVTGDGEIIPHPKINDFIKEWRNFPRGTDNVLDAVERALTGALKIGLQPVTATMDDLTEEEREEAMRVQEEESRQRPTYNQKAIRNRMFERSTNAIFH